ncbi:hypothetical protein MKQ68_09150 [Chitinophaga horti]|uniref:Uncharacterized protein n=1 Tax=Chitinophaga horti TaxID=2920382 RepID=A0ABY6J6N9_9BACT|nr:hypothetical protein [Chitinophaga horti]UYQ95262.1 hypothetical protein MKQ68_09150 [Chitinophaga horti]
MPHAGSNRAEIERIIDWYDQLDEGDERAAAGYLLARIPGEYGLQMRLADSAGKLTALPSAISIDSLEQLRHAPGSRLVIDTVWDASTITGSFLQSHIRLALNAWKHYPWARGYTFQQFTEYLLPYRVGIGPLMNGQQLFRDKYGAFIKDIPRAHDDTAQSLYRYFHTEANEHELTPLQYDVVTPFSDHVSETYIQQRELFPDLGELLIVEAYKLRAAGVAASFEYCTYMPRRNGMEGIVVLMDTAGKFINPYQWAYGNNLAKMYRHAPYADDSVKNPFREIQLLGVPEHDVPLALNLPRALDVTASRLSTVGFKIALDSAGAASQRVLYLGVYCNGDWKIVDWSPVKQDTVAFRNIGSDGLFHLLSYSRGKTTPVGAPFKVENGAPHYYIGGKTEDMVIKTGDAGEPLQAGMNYVFSYWDHHTPGWITYPFRHTGGERHTIPHIPSETIYKVERVGAVTPVRIYTYANWIGQWYW